MSDHRIRKISKQKSLLSQRFVNDLGNTRKNGFPECLNSCSVLCVRGKAHRKKLKVMKLCLEHVLGLCLNMF